MNGYFCRLSIIAHMSVCVRVSVSANVSARLRLVLSHKFRFAISHHH